MNVIIVLIGIAALAEFLVPLHVKIGLDFKPFACGKCLAFWMSLFYVSIFTDINMMNSVFYAFFTYQIAGLIYKYL